MTIMVNSRKKDHVPGESVNRLLKRMKFIHPMVIVKVNGEVIPKAKYIETIIPDEAFVEVMHIESGG
jgi:thiamine biosynthesis protein ThiS